MKTLIVTTSTIFICCMLMAQTPATALKLNLEKGKLYSLKNVSNQDLQRSANGQDISLKINSNIVTSFKTLDMENDVMLMEFKFDTIEINTSYPGGKFEINSAKPAKKNEYFGKVMNKVSSLTLSAKVSTSGKFMGFTDYKTFRANILSIIDSIPATQKEMIQKQTESFLKESKLQSMIEPLFAYLPEKSVSIGEKWENSFVQADDRISLMLFNTYTLLSTENNMAKISGISEIEAMPSNDSAQPGGPQTTKEAKGTSSSDLMVDQSTGIVSKGSGKNHMELTFITKSQGSENKANVVIDSKFEITKIQ